MKSNLATNTFRWLARDCGSKECNLDGFRFALAGIQKLALVLAMIFLLLAPNATTHAQDIRGQIQGKIVDSSGAFVEGARITAVELATSVGKTGVSNSKGDFVMPFLPTGHYRVTVEKEGFKRYEQNDILLQVSDNISLSISLQIGDVATGVTVNSTDQGIRIADADLGSVIEARQLEDLPVKDNNPLLMATLSAGVLDFASSSSGGQTQAFTSSTPSNISISGVASSGANGGNTYTLDGAPNNAGNRNGVGYNQAFTPTTAMVSEFKIQTATYDASSGYGPGANVNLSLKSGTDHFHGQLYETMQNPVLNANSYFTNLAGLPKDNNRQHDWSAVISGPVILPKIYNGRSRTFFMYGYNGISNSFPKSTNAVYSVPTDAERRGDFSALLASGIKIYNPYSTVKDPANAGHFIRTPFANNVIPFGSSLSGHQFNMDSYAKYILNTHMPRPNLAGVADGENNLVLQQYQTNWYQSHVARIDHTINDHHSLFGHFYYSHLDEYDQIRFNRGAGWTYFRDNRGFDVDDVYTFTPRLVLNTRASVTRYSTATVPVTEGEDLDQQHRPRPYPPARHRHRGHAGVFRQRPRQLSKHNLEHSLERHLAAGKPLVEAG